MPLSHICIVKDLLFSSFSLSVDAINKIIDHWNLRSKLNLRDDPCIENAIWAPDSANPRIACDCVGTVCHITHLKIYALDISGEIPQELFLLTELMDLNLNQNVLNGSIPPEIGLLSKMEYLALGINNFTGSVPAALGNLTRLRSLSFGSNNLQGTLPRELGNLTLLDQLYIDSSGLSGPIPQELSNLASLQTIWMSDNGFTGELPEFLSTFTELKDLRVEGTNLKGPIPNSFSALTKLENLRIGDLNVGESDSSLDFLENLTSLSILSLRNCQIRGPIPQRLSTFPNLTFLDLSFNKLTGQIPASFKDFSSLKYLYLGSNNIDGVLPSDIGSKLLALDVSFNPLTGNIPLDWSHVSINTVGTSINDVNLKNQKASTMLQCLDQNINCKNKAPSNSFAVNSGGPEQADTNGSVYDDDSEKLGAASLYTSSSNKWAVSSSGVFISNINGPIYIAQTDSQIANTLDSELYKTARIAPASLRYYGLSLENGVYRVELHFAEVVMDYDSASWEGLGRRVFDVYIQVFGYFSRLFFRVRTDSVSTMQGRESVARFQHSKRGRRVEEGVNQDVQCQCDEHADRHSSDVGWEGDLLHSTAEHVWPFVVGDTLCTCAVSAYEDSSKGEGKRVGRIVGIVFGCVGGLVVACGVAYFWWTKKESGDLKIYTQAPKD
ncbi:hypothetical protein SASPL_130997 [Salvia splendens]|uniref:non-specific serine/threonine protein kinase n=1 Tax=Salvia splendens TaxID=180675 RepID=A0A8X8X713_SALSN|nr:hypothetical protein SASPL_130997 [Salvia splendens]